MTKHPLVPASQVQWFFLFVLTLCIQKKKMQSLPCTLSSVRFSCSLISMRKQVFFPPVQVHTCTCAGLYCVNTDTIRKLYHCKSLPFCISVISLHITRSRDFQWSDWVTSHPCQWLSALTKWRKGWSGHFHVIWNKMWWLYYYVEATQPFRPLIFIA